LVPKADSILLIAARGYASVPQLEGETAGVSLGACFEPATAVPPFFAVLAWAPCPFAVAWCALLEPELLEEEPLW